MKRNLKFLLFTMILAAAGLLLSASPLQVPSGAWIAADAMNSARSGAAALLLQDGRILITGGSGASGPANSAELFGSNGSFSLASPMNVPRSGHVAVVLQDGRVLVAGGITSGGAVTNTAEIFDPSSNTWTSVTGGMVEARSGLTAALLHDGRVAIAGGNNGTLISSTVEVFNPTQSRFSAVGTMSSPRTRHAMTVLQDGRVLIVGGNNGTAPVASSDLFDPVAGRISAGPNLSVARFAHSATTLLNGLVVVIGGNNGNANPAQMDVTPAELFDPTAATPAFTTLSSNLATPREGHLAFLLPNNNNVLIVGGTSGGAPVASAELFLPEESSTGVWTYVFGATGAMSTARSSAAGAANQVSSPSSVMQANGMLLVAGGSGASGNTLNSAELYGFATIQTDHGDYPPGQTVTMTGSGWKPGETVTLTLVESPLIDTGSPFTAVADANGNITDTSFTTDYHDVNVKFTLTAVGSVSRAQMTFTDGSTGSVTFNNANTPAAAFNSSSFSKPMTVTAGGTNTVAFATVWVDEGSGAAGTTFNVTATYGGQAMTSAGPASYDYNYAPISSQVFYLVNPPTGTNTLAINATASSGTIQEVVANLISYNGVSQSAPVRPGTYQAIHSATNVTVGSFTATLASNASDLTLGALEATYTFASPASNQTVDGTASAYYKVGSDHATTAAASVSDTWSFTNPYAFYAYVGFSIQAASGGSTPTLTYTANPVSRVYGAANPALTGTVTGFNGTDTLANSTTGTLAFTTTATASSGAGSYPINGSGLSSSTYSFAQAASNATALTITPATPTVTVTGGTYSHDGNAHPATATAVGIDGHTAVNGTFSFTYTPPGNSTVPVNAGTYSVTATFTSSDPNYSNATGSGSITITPSSSSTNVTLNNTNTVVAAFGNSLLSAPMTVTPGGTNTVAFATVWVDEGSGASGTTFNVTATYGGNAMTSAGATAYDYNYAPISSQVFYLVNPPTGTNTLTVTATASSGTIQEVVANLISYNGVNQTAPVRPGTYQTLHSANGVLVGEFTATLTSNLGDLTLGAVEATYTFASPASNQSVDAIGNAYFKVGSDHATAGVSSISDAWSFTGPYSYYAYVGFSIQSAYIAPTLTYSANPASRVYGATNPAFTGTVTGFTGSDTQTNSTTGTLTFTSPATASSGAGTYPINGSGLASSSYAFVQAASNATALTITQATPTITVTGGTFAYDGKSHAATATAVGADGITPVSGTFSFTYTPPGNSAVPINGGTYSVTATFTSSDPNYSNASGSASITIASSATLTYTANPISRSYGAANPAFTGAVTGFVGPDTQASATTGTLTFSSAATASSSVGSYAIVGSGLTSNNGEYAFQQAAANANALTITPATPTLTVTGGTFIFDGNSHGATATALGVDGHTPVSGTFSITYSPPGNPTIPSTPGTYSVTVSFTSSDPNYNNAAGSASITISNPVPSLMSSGSVPVTLNNANTPAAAFNSSSFSKPMTVAAGGTNTVAFATVWVDEGSGASGTTFNVTATYAGQAMTSAGATAYDYNYAPISSQVFYLVNPPTGTNTLVINATASSGTIQEVVANLVSFNGVSQTTPVRPGTYQTLHSASGPIGSFTATILSNPSDLTLGAVEGTFAFASPASNQTLDGTSAPDFRVGSDHGVTGASSVTDTWSFTNPYAFYAYVAFSIEAANAGSTSGALSPSSASAGGAAFTLTVNGSNFTPASVVQWNGSNRATSYVSTTQLTVPVNTADIATPGGSNITVVNPLPGGGTSLPASFTINGTVPVNSSFVSPTGSDSNPGTITQPYLTIQKCATSVASGGTCELRAGTYHETVTPNSGITITSYGGESVTVDGSDPVTGWTFYQGSIYKANVTLSSGDTNQIFVGNQMMTEARWPNGNDLFNVNWAIAKAGTTATQIVDPNLPNIDWTGANVHLWSGTDPWSNLTATVTASGPGQITIALDQTAGCPELCPTAGGYYYVFGVLGALDSPNEWVYDPTANVLYFWAPGGVDPNTLDVRAKQRPYAFDLSGKSGVTVQNINIFASTINSDSSSTNDIMDGINAEYVSHFTTLPSTADTPLTVHMADSGIIINGNGNTLRNSTIAYSAGNGVVLLGSDNTVKNNLIHHIDYIGNYDAGIALLGNSTPTQNSTIQNNTIYKVGRQAVWITDWAGSVQGADISYNNLFNGMIFSRDGGEIYACCNMLVATGTRIHHNWIHDTQSLIPGAADNYPASGIYFDIDASGFEVDQNVLWNNQYDSIYLHGSGGDTTPPNDNNVHNNSIPDVNSTSFIWLYAVPACGTTQVVNNLVLVPVNLVDVDPTCTVSGNNAAALGADEMNSSVQVGCNFAGCSSNGPPVISGGSVAASVAIPPSNVTVTAGQTATFSVTAAGSPTISYQWQENGIAIAGATNSTYTTSATTAANNGAVFTVQVGNSFGSATSNPAILTVD